MDTAQWPQEIVVKPLEEIVTNTFPKPPRLPQPAEQANSSAVGGGGSVEKKARPQKDQALNCPRCNSTNTKFCYYNNYSLTQPRYFCKTCRRYWTEGGSLRNIPVGGGSRKNKRSNSSNPSTSTPTPAPKKLLSDHHLIGVTPTSLTGQNPKFQETQDLNLGFPHGFTSNFSELVNNNKNPLFVSSCSTSSTTATSIATSQVSALDLLNNNNSFMGLPVHHQDPSGFGNNIAMQEFKPTTLLGFPLDGINGGGGYQLGSDQDEAANRRLLFSFEDLKLPVSSSTSDIDQKQGDASCGFWTGMLSGGSW